jgi:hypothetical protein
LVHRIQPDVGLQECTEQRHLKRDHAYETAALEGVGLGARRIQVRDAARLDGHCRKDKFVQFCRKIRGHGRRGASGVTASAIAAF